MNKVALKSANIPFALGTCYQMHSKKRVDWLTRTGPEGRRGRELWVDVPGYNAWAAPRRHPQLKQGERLNLS